MKVRTVAKLGKFSRGYPQTLAPTWRGRISLLPVCVDISTEQLGGGGPQHCYI